MPSGQPSFRARYKFFPNKVKLVAGLCWVHPNSKTETETLLLPAFLQKCRPVLKVLRCLRRLLTLSKQWGGESFQSLWETIPLFSQDALRSSYRVGKNIPGEFNYQLLNSSAILGGDSAHALRMRQLSAPGARPGRAGSAWRSQRSAPCRSRTRTRAGRRGLVRLTCSGHPHGLPESRPGPVGGGSPAVRGELRPRASGSLGTRVAAGGGGAQTQRTLGSRPPPACLARWDAPRGMPGWKECF